MADADDPIHVLVIEDNPAARHMLTEMLTRDGHQVFAVESAEAGLELLPTVSLQVAFVDHNLPGMDGLILGEYLRRNNPEMAVVMVSASEEPGLPRKARAAGVSFLPKPYLREQVQQVMEEYVHDATERRQSAAHRSGNDFAPPMSAYADLLTECFALPKVPGRVSDGLVQVIRRALNDLRSPSRYTERDRVVAFSGLVSARVLGLKLPNAPSGRSYYEEYDALMVSHGRRAEFGAVPDDD